MDSQEENEVLLNEVKDIKDSSEENLLSLDNVNAVGIGYKESKKQSSSQLCIKVFVQEKCKESD